MTDFIRLRDQNDATDVELALLESAKGDAPSALSRQRTLLALGVGAGAASALASGTAHAATSTLAGSSAGAAPSAAAGALGGGSAVAGAGAPMAGAALGSAKGMAGAATALIAKWVGIGVVAGTICTGGVIAVTRTPHRAAAPVSEPRDARGAARTTAKTNGPAPESTRTERVQRRSESAAFATAAAGSAAPRVAPRLEVSSPAPVEPAEELVPPRPVTSSGVLVAEVASLDRVRRDLANGDARAALARLTTHEQTFHEGALKPEAVLLRVRALMQLGRRGEAVAVVERFLAAHPGSAQADRLRALIGVTTGPE